MSARGWYGLPCWNALSAAQQDRLIVVGNLPLGWKAEGDGCNRGAAVSVETIDDEAPGPRFYCLPCAAVYLRERAQGWHVKTDVLTHQAFACNCALGRNHIT